MEKIFKTGPIIVVLLSTILLACVDPYLLDFATQSNILYLEADLNDLDSNQVIKVKRNLPSEKSPSFLGIDNATVSIVDETGNQINTVYTKDGIYALPPKFRSKVGLGYTLNITLANGTKYKSNVQKSMPVPAIDTAYHVFSKNAVLFEKKNLDANKVYVDIKDPASEANYYLWKYKFFEKKEVCISCEGGRYFTTPSPLGRCVDDANLIRRNVTYDYFCNKECYKIYYSESINVMSDVLNNGRTIKARLIASVPFLQYTGALIEIQQYSINREAFEYYETLVSQAQSTGTLSDTPPVGLIGNVKNLANADEPVGGIFSISSKKTKKLFIRRPLPAPGPRLHGLLGGRDLQPEPSNPADFSRPPTAPCLETDNSTGKRPIGWIN